MEPTAPTIMTTPCRSALAISFRRRQLMQRASDHLNAIAHLMRYSMMALWSTAAGVAVLLSSSTSGIAKSDKIISSLKSSI